MTDLDSIFKSTDITLLTKVCLVKAMVFLVVMDGRESWTMKKAECEELKLSNCGAREDFSKSLGQQGDQASQPILKEINSQYTLEGLMLKFQYFSHLM